MTLRVMAVRVAMGILLVHAPRSEAQTAAARPEFEVASIKPNPGCEKNRGLGDPPPSPGRLQISCITLQNLIQAAYGTLGNGSSPNVQQLPTSGGPDWIRTEFYSLAAKAEGAARVEVMVGPMLRALLEERFKLKVRRETREMAVYALTVGKSGLKVQPLKEGSCTPLDVNHIPRPPAPGEPMPNICGSMTTRMNRGTMTMEVRGVTMTQFCQRLSGLVDRPVIDKTATGGKFDFHLEFTPDETTGGLGGRGGRGEPGSPGDPGSAAPPVATAGPSIVAALQEKLGLKLVPEKGPVEYLAIDHVEKPAEN